MPETRLALHPGPGKGDGPPGRSSRHHIRGDARGRRSVHRGSGMSTNGTRRLDVAAIRKDFPILDTGIAYLDSANTSQRPRQVTGAMMDYFEHFNSNIHRSAYHLAEVATERYEASRGKVPAFTHAASTKEIIYTRRTTESIN